MAMIMGKKMFDYVIGNPPYQEDAKDTSDRPVYNIFMDAAFKLSDKVELITPARFLFNAGKTPKSWNEERLSDPHFKVLEYEQKSDKVFPNTDINGGVAVTYRDATKDFGAIGIFSVFPELNSIKNKVVRGNFSSFSDLVYAPESYKFSEDFHKDYPNVAYREFDGNSEGILSKGHENDIVTNIFSKLPDVFTDSKPDDGEVYAMFVGLVGNKRYNRFVKKRYIRPHPNFEKYKVILPKSNGSGAIGEVLSTPLVGEPLVGHTQSFISIGAFETNAEANACLKYIKTKFARAMLGILKVTQDNKKAVWKLVPLQDFTSSSDIDWSRPIPDIDTQLYRKYGLTPAEISFIESHVKSME